MTGPEIVGGVSSQAGLASIRLRPVVGRQLASLIDWAKQETWSLTIAEAEEMHGILDGIDGGTEVSGDHKPNEQEHD